MNLKHGQWSRVNICHDHSHYYYNSSLASMFLSSSLQVGILQTHWEAARHNLKVSQKDAGVSETDSSMLKIMNPSEALAIGAEIEMPLETSQCKTQASTDCFKVTHIDLGLVPPQRVKGEGEVCENRNLRVFLIYFSTCNFYKTVT